MDELVKRAQDGDPQAMYDVGAVVFTSYNQKGNAAQGMHEALPWFKRAAAAGHVPAAYQVVLQSCMDMLSSRMLRDFDGVRDAALDIIESAEVVMDDEGNDWHQEVYQKLQNAHYNLALSCYITKQKEEAEVHAGQASVLDDNDRMAKVLWGLCIRQNDIKRAESQGVHLREQDLGRAYDLLKVLEDGIEKVLPAEPDAFDQIIVGTAVGNLSTYYRMVEYDNTKAYNILQEGINNLDHDDVRNMLSNELSHYRKKVFGGYQYV